MASAQSSQGHTHRCLFVRVRETISMEKGIISDDNKPFLTFFAWLFVPTHRGTYTINVSVAVLERGFPFFLLWSLFLFSVDTSRKEGENEMIT